ncbi:hypothetical protein SGLAD_v1c05420 [Spiroplasma gladiatoris]|uniref:Uncharacterized protein n=1 Tax=Spiroplasma gladiatoris TaxID=2143 RepID=A0A4P7AHW6_9MOLU|nr:hypothetical protein [Spiroplasma gladiatoris]QBQ07741.1 hypothetical protein SGLAD_v1c05420 [Spiroplasma gladiatoris]
MEKCQNPECSNEINSQDPKRIYVFDEKIEDEIPVAVCNECYKKSKAEENDIDWSHSVNEEEE